MAQQEFSIVKLAQRLTTEADAYLMLEELRWGGKPTACPKCGGMDRCYLLTPRGGATKTRTGASTQRRVWKCGHCRKQFSVLVDTVFHGTKISIRTWLFVIFEFCASKNSLSAWEVSRKYSITNESAWHMIHRIREATKREQLAGLFRGTVQADETWIGGKPSNRHRVTGATLPDVISHNTDEGFFDPVSFLSALLRISPKDAAKAREEATTAAGPDLGEEHRQR